MPGGALPGARVVLGVCGGIAAYKAIEVCRRLVDAGAHVAPVMTRGATRFVGEVTFSALASEPVRTTLWGSPEPIPHTRLGQGADVVLVAPATARLLGSYRAGISSDLLTATLLATRAPVVVCPAMHTEMWEHPAVQENLDVLRSRGVTVVPPAEGRLAGGDSGRGRLADPADIVAAVAAVLASPAGDPAAPASSAGGDPNPAAAVLVGGVPGRAEDIGTPQLLGRRAVVTAGGTREPIDPVRYVGNRSSGKQGHAIADELAARGAAVILVTTAGLPGPPGAEVIRVETAAQMHAAVTAHAPAADIVVMAAAVADYRPKTVAPHKLKKADGPPEVVLEPTPDILAELGAHRRAGQVLAGFAAETLTGDDLVAAARAKLKAKNVDLIVANDVAAPGVGFGHDTNAVRIVARHGPVVDVDLRDKRSVAAAVVDAIIEDLQPIPPGGTAALFGASRRPLSPTSPQEQP